MPQRCALRRRVGINERFWPAAHRTYATEQRLVCRRSPRDCSCHGRIHASAYRGFAETCHGKGRTHGLRLLSHAFQMIYRAD
jgi:hypothetical protein